MTGGIAVRSLCVVGGELFGGSAVGGAERQIAMIAQGLDARGWSVSAVVREVAGVDASNVWRFGPTFVFHGDPGFRTEWIPRIRQAAVESRSQLFYQRGVSVFTIAAYQATRSRHAVFVWSASSDADMDKFIDRYSRSFSQRSARGRGGILRCIAGALVDAAIHARARRAASRADLIIAQHAVQAAVIVRAFRVPAERVIVVPSLVDTSFVVTDTSTRDSILWVGADKPVKRPELFEEIRRRVDRDVVFRMVGKGIGVSPTADARLQREGELSHEQLRREYSSALLLVNTSEAEGFPNTFLEAWQCGTPVVTIGIDPGGVISTRGLGFVAEDVESAAGFIRSAVDGDVDLGAMSRSCVEYVRVHHDPAASLDLLADRLTALAEGGAE